MDPRPERTQKRTREDFICLSFNNGSSSVILFYRESSNSSQTLLKTTMVIQDSSIPAAPPPQIRILKRPASNGSLASSMNQNRPAPQVKSLAQREAEYAEARKRILGSASAEDEVQDKPNNDR